MLLNPKIYFILGAFLFSCGIFGLITRRNLIAVLMAIELILNSVNINLVTVSRSLDPGSFDPLAGQIFALFIIAVAAAETSIGLAIVILLFRTHRGTHIEQINLLRW